jgi:RHS repeat-associated protein
VQGRRGFTVDAAGNLTARGSDTFGFDAANRLTSATVAGTTTTTTYDGDGIRVGEQTGSATATSFVNDVATSRTDEFGVPTASTGSTTSPYGYTGEPVDPNGLVHLRARTYDPTLGRFISRDTWPGDPASSQTLNRYAYVGNDPVNTTDPSGHCGIDIVADAGFAIVSGATLQSDFSSVRDLVDRIDVARAAIIPRSATGSARA